MPRLAVKFPPFAIYVLVCLLEEDRMVMLTFDEAIVATVKTVIAEFEEAELISGPTGRADSLHQDYKVRDLRTGESFKVVDRREDSTSMRAENIRAQMRINLGRKKGGS
jgi:hypothetical protein